MVASNTYSKYSKSIFSGFVFAALVFGSLVAFGDGRVWAADMYFNSSEPGCDGSNPNYLMCDDFEDGNWYTLDADQANSSGGLLQTQGWAGTIYANPITPAGAAQCGGIGVGTTCAATTGVKNGSVGARNMAKHSFSPGPLTEVQEVYVRYYYKASVGYSWSGEKHLTINRCCNTAGIFWGSLGFNTNGPSAPSTNPPALVFSNYRAGAGALGNLFQNQGQNISIVGGRWYYFEAHIKLNTIGSSDGIFEFFANDCGTAGTSCSGSPTLRMRHTGIPFAKTSSNGGVGTLWFENWANAGNSVGSTGQGWLDQVVVSKTGPIGFMGGAPVPPPNAAPSGLTVGSP